MGVWEEQMAWQRDSLCYGPEAGYPPHDQGNVSTFFSLGPLSLSLILDRLQREATPLPLHTGSHTEALPASDLHDTQQRHARTKQSGQDRHTSTCRHTHGSTLCSCNGML